MGRIDGVISGLTDMEDTLMNNAAIVWCFAVGLNHPRRYTAAGCVPGSLESQKIFSLSGQGATE